MKKFNLIIAALALSGAAFAQTSAKDSIAAVKAAEKAAKVQKAADLKAFKEKQKKDLAAFIEAQKNGKSASLAPIELTSTEDSVAHLFGLAQSNGLGQYLKMQFGVEDDNLAEFCNGVMDRVNVDPKDKAATAYSAGSQIGSQIINMADGFSKDYYAAEPGKKADAKIVAHGILAGLLGKGEVSADEAGGKFQTIMTARQNANKEALYGANREAGQKFLEENKTKEGVVTLPSGLQYKIITAGAGDKPKATDKVKVNYEGKLIDGTVFDSSIKRGTPATFQVNQVIKGWTEALQLMPVGSKWELYIPYDLAYGDRETGREIKPYSMLIFSVELLGIESK